MTTSKRTSKASIPATTADAVIVPTEPKESAPMTESTETMPTETESTELQDSATPTVPASLVNGNADKVKLPTIPAELPSTLATYGETKGKMAKWQIAELRDDLSFLREHGAHLLRQHDVSAVAESEWNAAKDSDAYKAYQAAMANAVELRRQAVEIETKANADRTAQIEAIVSTRAANSDIDLEIEKGRYGKKYDYLATKAAIGMWTAIAPEVGAAYTAFLATLPSAEELQRGERKRTSAKVSGTGKDMRPGSKKSFAWWEFDGKRMAATTYADVAKETGLKSVTAAILTNRLLDSNKQGHAELVDGETYSFDLTVDGVQHSFRCQPVKRGTKADTATVPAAPAESATDTPAESAAPDSSAEFTEPVL